MDPVNLVLFVFGIAIGSFLNVLIDRLPQGLDVIKGRSRCDHCGRTLAWFELVPILSWVIQNGQSRCCHKKLSIQYPVVELFVGIGFVCIYQWFGVSDISSSFFATILLFCASVGIFVADLKTEYIPEVFLYAGFISVIILLFPFIAPCFTGTQASCALLMNTYILPAGIGAGFFFLLWLFSKGKAMGDGDIYIAGIIGLFLGYPRLIVAYYVAFLTGAIVGVILILVRKKRMKSHIPFGPFMILGLGIASIYGAHIVRWWSQLW